MWRKCGIVLATVLAVGLAAPVARAEFKKAERPFVLWNKADLDAARKKLATDDWAKAAFEKMPAREGSHGKVMYDLFRLAVTDGEELAAKEKKELLKVARSPEPRGAAQYFNVVRYDMLYDKLTEEERGEVEKFFRTYIEHQIVKRSILDPKVFNNEANFSRYDALKYTRTNWLPNIIWPYKVSANLMALALQDERLIRATWKEYGSWKWYFDDYLRDSGFYGEEFSKMGSTPGAMLIYCRAAERLGLDELGYGYRGKGGATMRGHLESLIHLTYPSVQLPTPRWHYPLVTMGDLRQSGSSQSGNLPSLAFQHSLVRGYFDLENGGDDRWKAHGAWGGVIRGEFKQWDGYSNFTPKMLIPYWFEIGHAKWPEARFDYFLAQMRAPDEKEYIPSLYFGLEPIQPAKVKAPPAPSAVWPERGIVMLRAEESPEYWRSAAPAIAMRLGSNYAHNVNDAFALLGFYAHNRPLYLNRQTWPGYAEGWSRSIQSHCGVTVDGQEPKFTENTVVQLDPDPHAKFVSASSKDVFPGVTLTRSLLLTRDFCLDVTQLADPKYKIHNYSWFVHALGQVEDLTPAKWAPARLPEGLGNFKEAAFKDVQGCDADGDFWGATVVQRYALENPAKAKLPKSWYDREIGVQFYMLGDPFMRAFYAPTPAPMWRKKDKSGVTTGHTTSEVGGVTFVAHSRAPIQSFAALHSPIAGNVRKIQSLKRICESFKGLVLAVEGEPGTGINDRLMLRIDGDWREKDGALIPVTLESQGERYVFTDWAHIRLGPDRVDIWGDLKELKLLVKGEPPVYLDGVQMLPKYENGFLISIKTLPTRR